MRARLRVKYNYLFYLVKALTCLQRKNTTENTEMLHTVNVRVNAGLLNENSLLPEVLQILQVVRPAWSVGNIQSKVDLDFNM